MAGDGGCSGWTACMRTRPRTLRSSMAGRRFSGGSRRPKGAGTPNVRTSAFRKLTKLDLAFLLILLGVGGRLLLLPAANAETGLAAAMLAGGLPRLRGPLRPPLAAVGG